MAGFEPTYEGIQEMILQDQYFLTCGKSLQIFLKEKGKLSLKEMTKASNDYFEAHGYPAENHERKINGVSNKAYTHKSNNYLLVNVYLPCVGTENRRAIVEDILYEMSVHMSNYKDCTWLLVSAVILIVTWIVEMRSR